MTAGMVALLVNVSEAGSQKYLKSQKLEIKILLDEKMHKHVFAYVS